jgi:hypothetical protein
MFTGLHGCIIPEQFVLETALQLCYLMEPKIVFLIIKTHCLLKVRVRYQLQNALFSRLHFRKRAKPHAFRKCGA